MIAGWLQAVTVMIEFPNAWSLVFQAMPLKTVACNVVSFNSAISSCSKGAQWQLAVQLLRTMQQVEAGRLKCSRKLAQSCCKNPGIEWNRWEYGWPLFAGCLWLRLFLGRNVQVAADVISCTAAINACEKDGRWWMAVKIFESLYKSALQPDQISFNTTIRACAKDGQWLLALELLDLMQDEETLGGQFHSHFCIFAFSAQQNGCGWLSQLKWTFAELSTSWRHWVYGTVAPQHSDFVPYRRIACW